uniref:Uncharacterized protein n=1 Tax=Acrobeloides nanus TaxID=290746 RepID=A0A914DZF2_9BILA
MNQVIRIKMFEEEMGVASSQNVITHSTVKSLFLLPDDAIIRLSYMVNGKKMGCKSSVGRDRRCFMSSRRIFNCSGYFYLGGISEISCSYGFERNRRRNESIRKSYSKTSFIAVSYYLLKQILYHNGTVFFSTSTFDYCVAQSNCRYYQREYLDRVRDHARLGLPVLTNDPQIRKVLKRLGNSVHVLCVLADAIAGGQGPDAAQEETQAITDGEEIFDHVMPLVIGRRRSKCRVGYLVIILMFLTILIWEEVNYGTLVNVYCNYYNHVVYLPITKNRHIETNRYSIGVIVVIENEDNLGQYDIALKTLRCYCLYQDYPLTIISVERNASYKKLCPQNDFMFRRHCIVAEFLERHQEFDWALFVDADMGVVNPSHFIEEYINEKFDLIFYERIFNYEIMAGSYLMRNSPYSRDFLKFWANYFYKLPHSFHGTDNGAIHNVFLEKFCGDCSKIVINCQRLWNTSRNFNDLNIYEACVRNILGARNFFDNRVLLLPKMQSWARDGWLTNSEWASQDFFLHGWQESKLNKMMFAGWNSPFVHHDIDMAKCSTKLAFQNWPYKDSFIQSNDEIRKRLNRISRKVHNSYLESLKSLDFY